MRGKLPEDFTEADRMRVKLAIAELLGIGHALADAEYIADCPMTAEEQVMLGHIQDGIDELIGTLQSKIGGQP